MNLLLTGAFKFSDNQLDELKALGFDITFVQDESNEINFNLNSIDAVVCNALFMHTPIERFSNLKFIQLTSAGTDRAPMDYIQDHNIRVDSARGVYSAPMAEWVIGKILEIYKHTHEFKALQLKNEWKKIRSLRELTGKTALILGTGSVGTAIAKRLQAFDVNVWGVDKITTTNNCYNKHFSINALNSLLPKADIIIVCLPLTDETKSLLDKAEFKFMKDDALLVNVSRGAIINENALIESLLAGKFAGVALDVFNNEPLPHDNPLWSFPQVSITPHISFISDNIHSRLYHLIKTNLLAFKQHHAG